jgi:hypothetical protein
MARSVSLGPRRNVTSSGANVAASGGAIGSAYFSGGWIAPALAPAPGALGANGLYASSISLPQPVSVTDIACQVTIGAASSFVRMGIYADNGNGYPGALVAGSDSGQIDASTATVKTFTYPTPLALSAGRYWLAGVSQGGAPTINCNTGMQPGLIGATAASVLASSQTAYFHGGVSGALPSTFTATLLSTTASHRVAIRVA